MNASSLTPSINSAFSESVVGRVLLRARLESIVTRNQIVQETLWTFVPDVENNFSQEPSLRDEIHRTVRSSSSVNSTGPLKSTISRSSPAARKKLNSETTKTSRTRGRRKQVQNPSKPSKKQSDDILQPMTSMQRYRKRIHDQTISLETDVRCLREEIQKLELQRHLVVSGIPTKITPFQVVSEYFSLFRYGYKPPMTTSGSSISDKAHVQKHFLETMFAPDVVLDHGSGISALLENWKMLARHWKDLDIRIKQLEHGEDNQIVATNTGCTIISEEMLKIAFPGLCSIKEHPLVTKLLGQPLAVQCKIFIKWDDSTTRIVGLRHQADPLPALLKLLGNLKIVSAVLNSPLVPPSW